MADLGYGFEPPTFTRGRPKVITWFRIYAAANAVVCAGLVAIWLWLGGSGAVQHASAPDPVLLPLGACVVFSAGFYALAAFVPYKPWGWTVGLVAIALGLVSGAFVFAAPLLVYWFRPETKAAFCRV